jgi:prefoldin subunit 5
MNVKMTTEVLNKNIAAVETAISFAEKKLEDTHSGVDQLLINSFIIETRQVLEVLKEAKAQDDEVIVFHLVESPEA